MELKRFISEFQRSLVNSHWRRYKNHSISTDEEERNRSFGCLVNFFVGFLVDLDCGYRLFSFGQNHVQVLIECLQ